MRNKTLFDLAAVMLGLLLGAVLISPPSMGRAAAQERPKLKNFGSSLDRLKWDQSKNVAVETRPKRKKKKPEEEDVLRVETSLVVCDVLILDRQGRPVEGLARDDFVVSEDGVPQQVGTFALGDNAAVPRSIVLIIDYSTSQLPFIKTSVESAKILVDKLNPGDRMAIVTAGVEVLADFTRDKERLKSKLESITKRAVSEYGLYYNPESRWFGRSAQFSALMATLKEAFDGEDLRPIIIFQTDGDELGLLRDPVFDILPPLHLLPPDMQKEQRRPAALMHKYRTDNLREFSLRDVYRAAEVARATIYPVIPGLRLVGLTPEQQLEQFRANREKHLAAWFKPGGAREKARERAKQMPVEAERYLMEQSLKVQTALLELARVTGGWADFLEDPSQAAEMYSRILSDINRRYVIGYYPANKERDDKRREVKIEVRGRPEYTVWGRKSYYVPSLDERGR
jgi:VWFA-related protein